MTLEQFIAEFNVVDSPQALNALIERSGLTQDGLDQTPGRQVYRVVGGVVAGRAVKLTHRWHDPSQAFSVKSDIAKVDLDIDGSRVSTVEWPE
jgi:hypothetical protein